MIRDAIERDRKVCGRLYVDGESLLIHPDAFAKHLRVIHEAP